MFKKFSDRFTPLLAFLSQPPVVLLVVSLLTYGIFIPLLKFFWDDMAIHWIANVYGVEGLQRYFSTNRPVWGFFYQLNYSLLGDSPWLWQIFGIFWRWAAATSLHYFLYLFWARRKEPALWAALLFLVYPGFAQQSIAMVYGHFFLILTCFFASMALTVLALQSSARQAFWLHFLATLLAALNLFAMEYFFLLELLRPLVIWYGTAHQIADRKARIFRTLRIWAPYALVWLAAVIWRVFIFNFQTQNYQPQMLTLLRNQPLSGLWQLLVLAVKDVYTTLIVAWGQVFQFSSFVGFGRNSLLMIAIFSSLTLVYLFLAFSSSHFKTGWEVKPGRVWLKPGLIIGLTGLILAGVAFWLTGLPVNLVFPFDRLTLPFMLSFSLLWVTFFYALPIKRPLRNTLLSILVMLACAHQLQTGVKFQRDWDLQSRFFWQLTWRAPTIEPGTVLFAHVLPITYSSDNSLSAALNWVYDPSGVKGDGAIPYILYYPSIRLGGSLGTLQPDLTIHHDQLVGSFEGNTSRSLALTYQPPGCLRILDPEIEADNWMVPLQVRETLDLVNNDLILPSSQARPPDFLYQPEPEPNWCYYFEKADLARQFGNWPEVLHLADLAFVLDDQPNDPAEWMPFIEAYAHSSDWQTAVSLAGKSAQITEVMQPVLCRLWQRIERETPASSERDHALMEMEKLLDCKLTADS